MLEWVLIAGVGAALVSGLFKGKPVATSSLPTPKPTPFRASQLGADEEKRQLAAWRERLEADVDRRRWISSGAVTRLLAKHPPPQLRYDVVRFAALLRFNASGRSDAHGLTADFDAHNAAFLERQKRDLRAFFDSVEKSPLTDEQIEACVCMDDNLLVVAAAGSGKTSTMVAKAGYVLEEGLARPDQILLLAFNRNAADELRERIQSRLKNFDGIDRIRADTFDSFGLSVIGKSTGEKPRLAPWVSDGSGSDVAAVIEMAHALSALDEGFRDRWNLFRTVYARDTGSLGEHSAPEDFDGSRRGFRTADGKVVKSKEEREISNWLFYNGVNYVYEPSYEYNTADEHHSQYHPDFYYPEISLYHEHFALDEEGRAPAHFPNYVEGVHWKRALHVEKRTTLFETTSAELRSHAGFSRLKAELLDHGVSLEFDADRPSVGPPPLTDEQLASTLRVFLGHVKSNRLSHADLDLAAENLGKTGHAYRLTLFLEIYKRIEEEWERRLRAGGYIDFHDMMRLAADHIAAGDYSSPFTVVLADEFQDSSRARVRLLQALTGISGNVHLTVVGDDWQGINRFAGADLRVMSEFGSFFDHSTTLKLATTFRCPQALCDISSAFVQANPKQLKKSVRSTSLYGKRPLQAFGFKDLDHVEEHIERQLSHMATLLSEGKLEAGKGGQTRVLLLGRYKSDKPGRLSRWQRTFAERLIIDFRTVHASKGLEAEYVYVLGLVEGRRGFPSQIEDDPVLQMAVPEAETFAMAEERRLFSFPTCRTTGPIQA